MCIRHYGATYIYYNVCSLTQHRHHKAPTNDIFRKSIDGVRLQRTARCLPHIEKTVARGALGAPATANLLPAGLLYAGDQTV